MLRICQRHMYTTYTICPLSLFFLLYFAHLTTKRLCSCYHVLSRLLAVYIPEIILIRAVLEPLSRLRTQCPYPWVVLAQGAFKIRNEACDKSKTYGKEGQPIER